jgi:hypothetical protein
MRDTDRASARRLLEVARGELVRAMALGYAGKDPEYKAIADDISNLEKQLKDTTDTGSVFSRLKQRLASFIKRQSETDRSVRPQADQKTDQNENKKPGTSAA